MKHTTIDYGIDLGTTNSAICRMEQGVPTIIRSDSGQETMPSCVSFKKGGLMRVGQSAYDDLGSDKLRALKRRSAQASTSCIEFKRFMGSDMIFKNAYTEHGWSPEELSAQVLHSLCSFVDDDEVKAAVITVPAKFTVNQKDATLEAARMAGIEQVELLQEPIAASMAYGLKAEEKNGIWMVFDFGGGTLDVALVHVSDGVMQVFDTEGDNYLGGKNIDEAIVAKILLPAIASQYAINLTDKQQAALLIDALKVEAEKLKNKLSFCNQETVYLEAGDWGEDEDGEDIELELTVPRTEVEQAMRPLLQKAVDVCKTLMLRNDLGFGQLSHLILIGGPTRIPLLRTMLREQISENVDTAIDPMTAVATGAAIYASTIPVKATKNDEDDGTLQLLVDFEATTVDTDVFVPVRMKSYAPGLVVKAVRRSDGWECQPAVIEEKGGMLVLNLVKKQPNIFRIVAMMNGVEEQCFPAELTIMQGTRAGSAILPYNIGIEVLNPKKSKCVFTAFTGLEKNRPLPATGTVYGLHTMSDLRPGFDNDVVRIAIYQGDDNAEGKTAALFEYVSDVTITGGDIVSFIPQGSTINIKIDVDRSEMMTIKAEFPESNQTVEKHLDTSRHQVTQTIEYLQTLITRAYSQLNKIDVDMDTSDEVNLMRFQLKQVEEALENGAQHKQVEQHLKEVLRKVEDFDTTSEWTRQYNRLKNAYFSLEATASRYNSVAGVDRMVQSFGTQVERMVMLKDMTRTKMLQVQIENYEYSLEQEDIYRNYIRNASSYFTSYKWKDEKRARMLVADAMKILEEDPNASLTKTRYIVDEIHSLRVFERKQESDGIILPNDIPSM